MGIGVRNVITIAVSLMIIALILPLGLGLLGLAGDFELIAWSNATGTPVPATLLSDVIDPSILTLLTVLIPILAVIGIAVSFISNRD